MNSRRVSQLKSNYAVRLIEILKILGQAAVRSEENVEAVRQIERVLLACLEFPAAPKQANPRTNDRAGGKNPMAKSSD